MPRFAQPSSTTGIQYDELKGALLAIEPLSFEAEIDTQFGKNSAVRANLTVLDGDKAGEVFRDTLIFPKVLQSQIKSSIGGGVVIGRLGQGQKKAGQSAPWLLNEATPEDYAIAEKMLPEEPEAPATDSGPAPY